MYQAFILAQMRKGSHLFINLNGLNCYLQDPAGRTPMPANGDYFRCEDFLQLNNPTQ
jgi:hypothetical protein